MGVTKSNAERALSTETPRGPHKLRIRGLCAVTMMNTVAVDGDTVCVDWRRGRLVHLICGRIVPGLSFAGSEDVVKRGTEDVHASRNEEHNLPLVHGWLEV